jgi:hypothetical protein
MGIKDMLQDLYDDIDRWETIARMNGQAKIADQMREWRTTLRRSIEILNRVKA